MVYEMAVSLKLIIYIYNGMLYEVMATLIE